MLGGSGDVELYESDNITADRLGNPLPMQGRYTTAPATIKRSTRAPTLPEGVKPTRAIEVQDSVLRNVGARPWDRDAHDKRILADTIEGRGKIINSEQEVGGYTRPETHIPTLRRIEVESAVHDAALELVARADHVLPTLVVVVRKPVCLRIHILILVFVGEIQRLARQLQVVGDVKGRREVDVERLDGPFDKPIALLESAGITMFRARHRGEIRPAIRRGYPAPRT